MPCYPPPQPGSPSIRTLQTLTPWRFLSVERASSPSCPPLQVSDHQLQRCDVHVCHMTLTCLIDCLLEMEGFLLSKDHVELTLQFTSISLLNTCINFCIFPDLALNFETTPVVPLVETSNWILSSIWFKAGVCNLFHKFSFSFQKLNYQYKPLKWSNIHQ